MPEAAGGPLGSTLSVQIDGACGFYARYDSFKFVISDFGCEMLRNERCNKAVQSVGTAPDTTPPPRLCILRQSHVFRNRGRCEAWCLHTDLRAPALEEFMWSNVQTRHESLSKSVRRVPPGTKSGLQGRACPLLAHCVPGVDHGPPSPTGNEDWTGSTCLVFSSFQAVKGFCQIKSKVEPNIKTKLPSLEQSLELSLGPLTLHGALCGSQQLQGHSLQSTINHWL